MAAILTYRINLSVFIHSEITFNIIQFTQHFGVCQFTGRKMPVNDLLRFNHNFGSLIKVKVPHQAASLDFSPTWNPATGGHTRGR